MAVGEVHKPLQCLGMQRVVRIDEGDVFGRDDIECGVTRCRWSAIRTRHQPYTLVSASVYGCYIGGIVSGTIINDYRLPVAERLRENAVKTFGKPRGGIVGRYDNGDAFHSDVEL